MKRILLLLLHLTLASFLASGETFISHTDGSISTVRPADMMSRTVTETDDGFIVSYSIAASAVATSTLTSGSILTAQMPCTEQQGTVGAHVGYGAYVVSLMVDNYPNDNVRIIVSHN